MSSTEGTPPGRPLPGRALLLLIGLLTAALAVGNYQESATPAEGRRAPLVELQLKMVVALVPLAPAAAEDQVAALERALEHPSDRLSLAIAARELNRETAQVILDSVEDPLADLVQQAFDEVDVLDENDRARLGDELGWAGRLLATQDPGQRRQLVDQAASLVARLGVLGLVALTALGLGLVLGILAIVQRRHPWCRFRLVAGGEDSGFGLEAMALYLAGSLAAGLLPQLPGGSRILLGVAWLAGVSGVAMVWPLLRGTGVAGWQRMLGLHRGQGWGREILAGAVGYVAILPLAACGFGLSLLLIELADRLGFSLPTPSHPLPEWFADGSAGERLLLLGLAAVVAPLLEETIFRGAFHRGLRGSLSLVPSALGGGLVFAAIHPQGPLLVPALMSLGAGFALLREWRDSLLAPITAHAIHNGSLVIVLWVLVG